MIAKRGKLTDGELGVCWAVANQKKGYSKISEEMKQWLLVTFNDHPHVVVSPIAKDTALLRNEREKVAVRKILRLDWGQFSLTSPMNTQQ